MITCTVCGYDKNPDGSEFCDACGAELQSTVAAPTNNATVDPFVPTSQPLDETFITETPAPEPSPATTSPSLTPHNPLPTGTTARLIAKQPNAPIAEFPLENNALIGIFDPDMGPVDIDLEDFAGNETVSRHHAEIYQDAGVWKVKDLGSTNGVFIKPVGQTRFSARITTPESLNSGDEVAIAKIRFVFQSP
ncbi:MAG: FHA domain-containing protein [Xenococcaceae cyanobacterium MO_167.B27]|nr:FHA domain-containing protein [Xenococcaceae cyanobacterium MO_167.B27]